MFIADVFEASGARVMVCSSDCSDDSVLAAIRAGAVGYLRKDNAHARRSSAPPSRAAANGTGVVEHGLLGNLLKGRHARGARPAHRRAVSPSASSRCWR